MAAMAPALTDAPAEARHIHFKLASPSTLSSGSTENNSNANIDSPLNHSNGKCPSNSDDGQAFSHYHSVKAQEQEPRSKAPSLGKLAPYLCPDVTSLATPTKVKESLKLQGVFIKQSVLKSHGLLASSIFHSPANGELLLRKCHTLTLSGGHLKNFINGGGAGSTMVPVNGLSKKMAVPSAAVAEKGSVATVNGDSNQPSTNEEALLSIYPKPNGLCTATGQSRDLKLPQNLIPGSEGVASSRDLTALSENTEIKADPEIPVREMMLERNNVVAAHESENGPSSLANESPSEPTPNLEVLLQDRSQQSQHRQKDIEGRLLRLRKRLQVVQAKQVERHFKQQLSGFVNCVLSPGSSRKADPGAWRGSRGPPYAHHLRRILKDGRVTSELERLHFSGSTHLRTTETQFDSDATESSSGGESDVEEEELARADLDQRHIKLWRRAEGRFARERATIISHWTWLQAQISELEYRIRQQGDIYRQLRANKGSVALGGDQRSTTEAKEDVISQKLAASQGRLTDSSCGEQSEASRDCSEGDLSSARTQPLTNCRRRRLLQPNTFQNLNGKSRRASFSPPRCCGVNPLCVMCSSASSQTKPDLQHHRPLLERVAHHDSSIHPVLSMQSDVALSVQLQKISKSHWQTLERIKPLKKTSLKRKLSSMPASSSPFTSSFLPKHKFRQSSAHAAALRLARHRAREERLHRQQAELDMQTPYRSGRLPDHSQSRKRLREASLDRADLLKVIVDADSPCPSLSSLQSISPVSRQPLLPMESSTPMGNSLPVRRRRGESPFDINNIVIPMSVAATTRVEKLQYKEILTPRWREVDVCTQPLAEDDTNVQVEDLSDAAFSKLHQPCEDQERSRWRWTALAPAKRRGSRSYKSTDGRTTPSLLGTNPPASPDTGHFHLLQDYGPVPSPLSPPSPDTPCSRDAHPPHIRDSQRLLHSEDTCGSASDLTFEEKTVLPWELRDFPLAEEPLVEPEADTDLPRFPVGLEDESESDASLP